jgi:hypothetical protein
MQGMRNVRCNLRIGSHDLGGIASAPVGIGGVNTVMDCPGMGGLGLPGGTQNLFRLVMERLSVIGRQGFGQ